MRTIIGGRCSGKTAETIKLACDTGAIIICANQERKRYIFERCKEKYGKHIAEQMNVFTIREIENGKHRGRKFNGVIVDDGDEVFGQLLNNLFLDSKFYIQFLTPYREINNDWGNLNTEVRGY